MITFVINMKPYEILLKKLGGKLTGGQSTSENTLALKMGDIPVWFFFILRQENMILIKQHKEMGDYLKGI